MAGRRSSGIRSLITRLDSAGGCAYRKFHLATSIARLCLSKISKCPTSFIILADAHFSHDISRNSVLVISPETGATLHGLEPTMTNELTRRQLLSVGAAASVAALPTPGILAGAAAPAEMPRRKFYAILSLGRLGFQASFPESLELTVKHGFEGLDPDPNYFASLGDEGLKRLLDDLWAKNLRFGAAGLPVEFSKGEARLNDGLRSLPGLAVIRQRDGGWRDATRVP